MVVAEPPHRWVYLLFRRFPRAIDVGADLTPLVERGVHVRDPAADDRCEMSTDRGDVPPADRVEAASIDHGGDLGCYRPRVATAVDVLKLDFTPVKPGPRVELTAREVADGHARGAEDATRSL
ncbi:hypothetical protein ATN37_01965 [Rhodococcus sp. MH15]|nr:hypothetical protein [Rhodococcus sp. MH15]